MTFLIIAVCILLFGLALQSTTAWIAIRVSKKRHLELWIHSGKPTLLGNGDLMKAWPLVKYYRQKKYLESCQQGAHQLPPVSDAKSLEFAERLRGPLVHTYYLGWFACLIALALLIMLSSPSS